jgi:hypothetical protein
MDAIIFRKREHLFERQRVVRTLKIMASMGPIAKVWPGSMRHPTWLPTPTTRSLVAMLRRDDSSDVWELVDSPERIDTPEPKKSPERIDSPEPKNSPERIDSPSELPHPP